MTNRRLSDADRLLIDDYIARHGVTECPRGASAETPDYIWQPSNGSHGGALVVKGGTTMIGRDRINERTRGAVREQARQRRVMKAEGRM